MPDLPPCPPHFIEPLGYNLKYALWWQSMAERLLEYVVHQEDCQLHKEWHRHKGCDCNLSALCSAIASAGKEKV